MNLSKNARTAKLKKWKIAKLRNYKIVRLKDCRIERLQKKMATPSSDAANGMEK